MNSDVDDFISTLPGVQSLSGAKGEKAGPWTHYAKKGWMSTSGGKVYGNWQDSFSGACAVWLNNSIEQGAIISIKEAGGCGDGDTVIVCQHN